MKKKLSSTAGVTLIEILIGILISMVMMAAMFTSYTVVNSTYSQVTDKANISSAGRDIIGMLLKDIRIAGFKWYNDPTPVSDKHAPIIITKAKEGNFGKDSHTCDKIEIVYGGVAGPPTGNPPVYDYETYKITYECKKSKILDKSKPKQGNTYPPIKAFAIYKSKVKWKNSDNDWANPTTDNNNNTYAPEIVVDYISDMVFHPLDETGQIIDPVPSIKTNKDKLRKIKTVEIALTVRSSKDFFKTSKKREVKAIINQKRNLGSKTDKILRETIVVTAHARNLGL